jgi:hypothetical protein
MSWTHEYEIGQEIKGYHHGAWRRGAVVSRRVRSLMVFLGKYGYVNIHDPRNVKPWQPEKAKSPSTSPDAPLFD